jgi:hypothetical protein
MKRTTIEKIIRALNKESVQYIIAGGMAVVAHGYARMTFDLDLIVKLNKKNILACFIALERLGYKPKAPITGMQFADKKIRDGWIRDKGMVVLNFFSEAHVETPIDIFVREPINFDRCFKVAPSEELSKGLPFRYVDINTLVKMKRKAGRYKDMDDIEHLKMLIKEDKYGKKCK